MLQKISNSFATFIQRLIAALLEIMRAFFDLVGAFSPFGMAQKPTPQPPADAQVPQRDDRRAQELHEKTQALEADIKRAREAPYKTPTYRIDAVTLMSGRMRVQATDIASNKYDFYLRTNAVDFVDPFANWPDNFLKVLGTEGEREPALFNMVSALNAEVMRQKLQMQKASLSVNEAQIDDVTQPHQPPRTPL